MAGVSCVLGAASTSYYSTSLRTVKCSSNPPTNQNRNTINSKKRTPILLKLAVSGVTEILRLFSIPSNDNGVVSRGEGEDKVAIPGVDDVLSVLKADYDNAYFLTGIFTSSIYADDCLFEDPTIRFRGTDLYSRNLRLLVPFFEQPSIALKKIEKGVDSERDFVLADWSLRTYLKLPWRPLIAIEGSTVYDLNDEYKIIRHAERWSVSALEAVGQIFTPGFGKSNY